MKHFDMDWDNFLGLLPKWQMLDTSARRCFLLEIPGKALFDPNQFGESAAPLLNAGLLTPASQLDGRVKVHPAFHGFRLVMKVMSSHSIFDIEKPFLNLHRYTSDHFTHEQRRYMFPRHMHAVKSIKIVTSLNWVDGFLALDRQDALDWENRHGNYPGQKTQLFTSEMLPTAQSLLNALLRHNGPVELSRLSEHLPQIPDKSWPIVIPACLHYMLLFAALRHPDLEPMLGIWPPSVERYNRPKPTCPQRLEPVETFKADILVQDMTTILSLCHACPIRVRSQDQQIFSKARTLVEDHLVTLPEWVTSLGYPPLPERIDLAVAALHDIRYMYIKGRSGRNFQLEVSKPGLDWLELTGAQRAKSLFDLLTKHHGSLTPLQREHFPWLAIANGYWVEQKNRITIKAALERSLAQLETDGFLSLEALTSYESIYANPLKKGVHAAELQEFYVNWRDPDRSEEHLEHIWREILSKFIVRRLATMGAIELGLTQDQQVCVALTDWGRYHLGKTDTFELPTQEAQDVLVQANFEVVFLGSHASAEAEIGRFAARVGKGMGTLFKISKASILQAAELGLTAEQVLSTLEKVTTKAIPANISREITGWFAACRQIRIKSTILIHCPDEETAMKIQALGKRDVTPLTPQILEVSSVKAKKTLLGKLRKQGIFIK